MDDFVQNPTDSNLISLRAQWHEALLTWQDVAFLNFGPSDYILMVSQTNTFPVDTTLIDSSINDGNWNFDYTSYYDAKGFQALDYLLNKRVNLIPKLAKISLPQKIRNYILKIFHLIC